MNVTCTYCGGTEFYSGPEGGLSTNILCANPNCRHWFNYSGGMLPLEDLNRIEPSDAQKIAERKTWEQDQAREKLSRILEGEAAFQNGRDPAELRKDAAYGNYAEAAPNVDRLVGYLRAMNQELTQLKALITPLG